MENNRRKPANSIFILMFFLFAGFPFLGAWFMGIYYLNLEERFRTESAVENLEKELREIVLKITPQHFFSLVFAEFNAMVASMDYRMEAVPAIEREMQNRFPFSFEVYYFDPRGNLVFPENSRSERAKLLSSAWRIMMGLKTEEDRRNERPVLNLLGSTFDYWKLRQNPGTAFPIFGKERNGLIFWEERKPAKSGGGLFFMWDTPPPFEILDKTISRFDDRTILIKRSFDGSCRFSRDTPNVDKAMVLSLVNKDTAFIQQEDWFVVSSRIADDKLFLAKQIPEVRISRFRGVFSLVLAGLLLGTWVIVRKSLGAGERFISIRVKLTVLFLYSTLFPIMGLSVLARQNLYERRDVLSGRVLQASQEALTQIDNNFLEEKNHWLQFFRAFRDDPALRTNMELMKKKGIELEKNEKVSWLEVRDITGNLLFTTERENVTQTIGVLASCMGRWCIGKFLQDRIPPGKEPSPLPAQILIQNTLESPMAGWGKISDRPDEIHLVKFGHFDLFWYWDIFRDPSHPAAIIQLDQKFEFIAREYLKKALSFRRDFEGGAFRFFSFQENTEKFFPEGSTGAAGGRNTRLGAPPGEGAPVPGELALFARRVRSARETLSEVISFEGKPHLLLGQPGRRLSGNILLSLYPMDEIDKPIKRLRVLIYYGIAIAIILSLLIGWILAEMFLKPIHELTMGVRALHARDPSVRIPDLNRDEFGDLGMAFNQTMEDVQELLFAKKIQTRLIPAIPPEVNGFQVDLFYMAASDVGGDYCDAVVHKDGDLLMVIGDVTGHGVSSALVMAMAKSVVFSYLQDRTPLTDLMTRLNRVLCRSLKRKKLMTFFSALLDPRTGSLKFSNAGHPLPIYVTPSGETTTLEIVHTPLGFSERGEGFSEAGTTIEPGGVVVFYTDGFMEMRDSAGKSWGMPKLTSIIRENRHGSPLQIREALVQEAEKSLAGRPLDDDLTLVILKRDLQ